MRNVEDWLTERRRFEPPVPRGFIRAEFGPSLAHYSARMKASVLERICSPVVRLCFGSLRFPSFARLMLGIWVTSNMRRRFGVRICPPGRAVSKGEPRLNARLMKTRRRTFARNDPR